jgi:flavin-dependent dehydrogenase
MSTAETHAPPLPARDRYDVVVVGARCAGAATALLLARAGLRVLAVDRGRHGADTLSTHALMRAGVLQLRRWGLLGAIAAAGTPPVASAIFVYGDEHLDLPIKPRHGVSAMFAPRRTLLDALLVDAARASGAEVRHRLAVTELARDRHGRVAGLALQSPAGEVAEVRADLVVGADGLASTVAAHAGAPTLHATTHATAVLYGYWPRAPIFARAAYRWYWRPGLGAGVIPTGDGLDCAFVLLPPARYQREVGAGAAALMARALAELDPDLAAALPPGRRVGPLRHFPGAPGVLRQAHGPGWALVGDAGYFKDPCTAHGISDALRDAELLARAVTGAAPGGLAGYQATRDDLSLPLLRVSDRIASLDWDLAALREDHRTLNQEMAREVEHLAALPAAPPLAA